MTIPSYIWLLLLLSVIFPVLPPQLYAVEADPNPQVEAQIFKDKEGRTIPYRLLIPAGTSREEKRPLVLCLHGAAGRGTDNMSRGSEAFAVLSQPEVQAKFPCYLLTPQCPKSHLWVNAPWEKGSYFMDDVAQSQEMKLVLKLLEDIQKRFQIDPDRLYVTGQSMGGYGTWDILLRNPTLFAAAIPVCGGGDPQKAPSLAHLPIWIVHGDIDKIVPVQASRDMHQALVAAGGKAQYTEFRRVSHDSWSKAWRNPEMISWLFAQRKTTASPAETLKSE